jgi:hypothetical protein
MESRVSQITTRLLKVWGNLDKEAKDALGHVFTLYTPHDLPKILHFLTIVNGQELDVFEAVLAHYERPPMLVSIPPCCKVVFPDTMISHFCRICGDESEEHPTVWGAYANGNPEEFPGDYSTSTAESIMDRICICAKCITTIEPRHTIQIIGRKFVVGGINPKCTLNQ